MGYNFTLLVDFYHLTGIIDFILHGAMNCYHLLVKWKVCSMYLYFPFNFHLVQCLSQFSIIIEIQLMLSQFLFIGVELSKCMNVVLEF